MKPPFQTLLLAASVTFSFSLAWAQPPAVVNNLGLETSQSAGIETAVKEGMKKWHSPGMAVGIVKGDRLVWSGYFGYADIDQQKPVSRDTVFRIGSISKTMTAVAMMQLAEQGKFKLDDRFDDYTPFPVFRPTHTCCEQPTFKNIFTHTSGGGEFKSIWYEPLFLSPGSRKRSLEEIFKRGIQTRICPGDKFAYCNYCVAALGLALENITGQSFQAYTDEHLFKPLGMNSSSFYETDQIVGNLAQGYQFKLKRFKPVESPVIELVPAGNVFSTVEDMSRYMAALLNGGKLDGSTLLKTETLEEMLTRQYSLDNRLSALGTSFFLDNAFGHRTASHGGGLPGFISEMLLAPDDQIGIIALNNSGSVAPVEVAFAIFQLLVNYQPPKAGVPPDPRILPLLAGNYVSPEPDFFTDARFLFATMGEYKIRLRKGRLWMASNWPGNSYLLRQVNPADPYFYQVVVKDSNIPNHIVFKPGADGKALSIVVGVNEYVRKGTPKRKPCEE